jgi:hypothetical protein
MGLAGFERYQVTELWPAGKMQTYSERELENFTCVIKCDKSPGGGLRILKLEVADTSKSPGSNSRK